ncbi:MULTISPECIES: carbohydrate ABC transporter permease [unclassified Paenibacillus]|uniref:carbohydrate ABC transporter permease n=1 Tax=unclassified Paenibacillus TaxID=185978 RepID=UPI001E4CDE1C|nr:MULTISPECIES: sugar ABC transporter permease [unclassified Paenibacillus]
MFKNPVAYLFFIVPTLLLYFVFYLYPLSSTVIYAFSDWDGLSEPVFNGLDNFRRALQDEQLFRSLWNNLAFTGFALIVQLPIIVGSAVLISEVRRWSGFYKTTFFMPAILSTPVVAVLWSFVVFHPEIGILNLTLRHLGLGHWARAWLADDHTALLSILVTNAWASIGFYIVLALAAIYGISREIHEAAQVDGASFWQRSLFITVPMIRPVISVIVLLKVAGSLKTLDIVMVMTGGGPAGLTDVMATYMYRVGFQYLESGYANTIAFIMVIFTVILTGITGYISKKLEEV